MRREYDGYVAAMKVLEKNKSDAKASTAVGRYLCLVKADWVAGLPMLANGADPALKALAAREPLARAAGTAAADRAPLAADWVKWAAGQPPAFRDAVARHAAELSGDAVAAASGAATTSPAAPTATVTPAPPGIARPVPSGFVQVLKGHAGPVKKLTFSPDGRLLVSEGTETPHNTTRLWDVRRGTEIRQFTPAVPVAFSADGKRMAVPTEGPKKGVRTLEVFDTAKWTSLRRFDDWGKAVHIAISADGRRVASSPWTEDLFVGDVATGRTIATAKAGAPKCGFSGGVTLSTDGKFVSGTIGYETKQHRMYDADTGKLRWHLGVEGTAQYFADGKRALVYGWGSWWVKDLAAGTAEGKGYRGGTQRFAGDSTRMIHHEREGDQTHVSVVDTIADKTLGRFDGHKKNPQATAICRDGRLALSADDTGLAALWDTQTMMEVGRIDTGVASVAASAEFSPVGDVAAIGCNDGAIRLWVLPVAPKAGAASARDGIPAKPGAITASPRVGTPGAPQPVVVAPAATTAGAAGAAAPLQDKPSLSDFQGAFWIWHAEGNPLKDAPVATRYFRREFDLPAGRKAARGTVAVTADDRFALFVNGTAVAKSRGTHDEWLSPPLVDVTPHLLPGRNVLALSATNAAKGPAGMIARLAVAFEGDIPRPLAVATDKSWKSSDVESEGWEGPAFDAAAWAAPMELKAFGDGKWGGNGWRLRLAPPPATPVSAGPTGGYDLPATSAALRGNDLRVTVSGAIGYWHSDSSFVEWTLDVKEAGAFEVDIAYSLSEGAGGDVAIALGDQRLTFSPQQTPGWTTPLTKRAGTLTLPVGRQTIRVRSAGTFNKALVDLWSLKLTPAKP